ncbi:Synembryn-A [Hondaea fermentalgiana]|uniref:Synembryn-A n=1 Tax=Hondaea fermentalgiana TaxID=2315210 RepID=A0A2R5GN19_9STRA|nr:Synembryn-A [Hondaea fermentalgiana]|eukprot:GBG31128.1 Synembryn-A [Hondaea fermentalgiana]
MLKERAAKFAEEAGQKLTQGESLGSLFVDENAQVDFYKDLAQYIREGKEVASALEATKIALCERKPAIKPLSEDPEVLAGVCAAAAEHLGSKVSHDALKCLNNALFDNPPAQSVFQSIDLARGAQPLAQVLAQTQDLEALKLAGNVGMIIIAARQGDASAEANAGAASEAAGVSSQDSSTDAQDEQVATETAALAEAALQGAVTLAAQLHGSTDGDEEDALNLFAGEDKGAAARAALTACFKLIYAAMVVQADVLASRAAVSRASRAGIDAQGLAAFLDSLRLDAQETPMIDRFALAVVQTLCAAQPASDATTSDTQRAEQHSVREVRLQAASVAMLACEIEGFCELFVRRGGLKGLLEILDFSLCEIASEVTDPVRAVQTVGELMPYIITCTRVVQESRRGLEEAQARVFPRTIPPLVRGDTETDAAFDARGKERQMAGDTPKDVLGGRLIVFLTCLNSSLKRCVGELLYELCDQSPNEMSRRCGYGNAAHMIAIKAGTIGDILKKQDEDRARRNEAQ